MGALRPSHGNIPLKEVRKNLVDVQLVKHAPLLSRVKRNP